MCKYFTQYKTHSERSVAGDLMPWILIALVIMITGIAALRFYIFVTRHNVSLHGKPYSYLYIKTGSNFHDVTKTLTGNGYLRHEKSFEWLARRKHYDIKVKAGRYRLTEGMSNNELVNLLRSGRQEPVRITIQNVRTKEDLAGKIGRHLETDSSALIRVFNDTRFLDRYELTPASLFVIFLPNTYEFFWNTSADQLFARMLHEQRRFWTSGRIKKAARLNLTIAEIVTLASILEKETNKKDEKPVMAGVYINRLKKRIPLQADPTVIYAWNDYTINRVLTKHTEIRSPYNTYLNTGLPPGPICIPSISSVDAVLNYEQHDYLYFCAKEDFSGYHNFAATLAGHNRNAKRYQNELDKLKIK